MRVEDKSVEESTFNDLTKRKKKSVIGKMLRPIVLVVLNPVTVALILAGLIIFGVCKFMYYMDEKNYPYGEYELTYRVYYSPNNTKDYTVTHTRPIIVNSHRGTNEVYLYDKGTVISTSAPIEVVRYVNKTK